MKVLSCAAAATVTHAVPVKQDADWLLNKAPEGVYKAINTSETRWIVLKNALSKRAVLVFSHGFLKPSNVTDGEFILTNEKVCFEIRAQGENYVPMY